MKSKEETTNQNVWTSEVDGDKYLDSFLRIRRKNFNNHADYYNLKVIKSPSKILDSKTIKDIKYKYNNYPGVSLRSLSKEYKVSTTTIYRYVTQI